MKQVLPIWHLSRQKQTIEQYFQTLFDQSLLQRKSGYSKAIFILPVPAGSFLRETSSYTTGKVSRFSKVWAQHIPGNLLPNPRVEATLLPAFVRVMNGSCWLVDEELQGWVHGEVNRKCDSPLLVQTNATRDHRQISLPHCLSATDDVTGIRPLPLP